MVPALAAAAGLLLLLLTAKRRPVAAVASPYAPPTPSTGSETPLAAVRSAPGAPAQVVAPGTVVTRLASVLRVSAVDRRGLLAAVRGTRVPAATTQPVPETPSADPIRRVLQLTNAARARGATCADSGYHGPVPALVWNDTLAAAAKQHADFMASNHYTGHDDPRGHLQDRASALGYDWSAVGENVASGQKTPEEVVAAWLASAHGHCTNLMDAGFVEFGAAVSRGSDGLLYWTQNFGARF